MSFQLTKFLLWGPSRKQCFSSNDLCQRLKLFLSSIFVFLVFRTSRVFDELWIVALGVHIVYCCSFEVVFKTKVCAT